MGNWSYVFILLIYYNNTCSEPANLSLIDGKEIFLNLQDYDEHPEFMKEAKDMIGFDSNENVEEFIITCLVFRERRETMYEELEKLKSEDEESEDQI